MGYPTFGHENKEEVQKNQHLVIKNLLCDAKVGENAFLDLSSSTHAMDDLLRESGVISNDTLLLAAENLNGDTSPSERGLPIVLSNGTKVEEEKMPKELLRSFICKSPSSKEYFQAAFYWLIYYNSLAFRTGKMVKIHHGDIENMDLSILDKLGIKLKLVNLDFCAGAKSTIFKWIFENRKYLEGAVISYTFSLEAFSRVAGKYGWVRFPFKGLKEDFDDLDSNTIASLAHRIGFEGNENDNCSNEERKSILGQAKQIIDMTDAASGGNSFSSEFKPTIYRSNKLNMLTFIQTFPTKNSAVKAKSVDIVSSKIPSKFSAMVAAARKASINTTEKIVYDKNKADKLSDISTGKELPIECITPSMFDEFCNVFLVPDKEKLRSFISSIENRRIKMMEQELPIVDADELARYKIFCDHLKEYCKNHRGSKVAFSKSCILANKRFMAGLTKEYVSRVIDEKVKNHDYVDCEEFIVRFKLHPSGGVGLRIDNDKKNGASTEQRVSVSTKEAVNKPSLASITSLVGKMNSNNETTCVTIADNLLAGALQAISEETRALEKNEKYIVAKKLLAIVTELNQRA